MIDFTDEMQYPFTLPAALRVHPMMRVHRGNYAATSAGDATTFDAAAASIGVGGGLLTLQLEDRVQRCELLCIDLDNVIHADGSLNLAAQQFIRDAAAWTEVSQSGTGLHVIVPRIEGAYDSSAAIALAPDDGYEYAKPPKIEWWCGDARRLFVVTGNNVPMFEKWRNLGHRAAAQIIKHSASRAPRIDAANVLPIAATPAAPMRAARVGSSDYDQFSNEINTAVQVMPAGVRAIWDGDYSACEKRSMALVDLARWLLLHGISAENVLNALMANDDAREVCTFNSNGIPRGGREWCWKYIVQRAVLDTQQPLSLLAERAEAAVAQAAEEFENRERPAWALNPEDFVSIDTEEDYVRLATGQSYTKRSVARSLGVAKSDLAILERDGRFIIAQERGFYPLGELIHNKNGVLYLNSWRGFAVTPWDGEDAGSDASVQPWLDHLAYMLHDPVQRGHVLDWIAYCVQHADKKSQWQLAIIGDHGIGKDVFFTPVHQLFGAAGTTLEEAALVSSFNGWRDGCKFVVFSELGASRHNGKGSARGASAQEVEVRLRELCSVNPTGVNINPKYGKPYKVDDLLQSVLISNHIDGIPINAGDRRLYAVECRFPEITFDDLMACNESGADHLQVLRAARAGICAAMLAWCEADGRAGLRKLLAWLQARDLSGFTANCPPARTRLLEEMEEATSSTPQVMMREAVEWMRKRGCVVVSATQIHRVMVMLAAMQKGTVHIEPTSQGFKRVITDARGGNLKRYDTNSRDGFLDRIVYPLCEIHSAFNAKKNEKPYPTQSDGELGKPLVLADFVRSCIHDSEKIVGDACAAQAFGHNELGK